MAFSDYFPIWDKLTRQQQEQISGVVEFRSVKKGTQIHDSSAECLGLVIVRTGQLRAYILSEDGVETLFGEAYRIKDGVMERICENGQCVVL